LLLYSHGQNLFELKAEIVPRYTESAVIYDHMMRDVDYKRWAEYILQLMKLGGIDTKHSNPREKRLCELGSGTANIAFHLSKYGFEVTCVDSSSQMLDIARTKSSRQKKSRLHFLDHDMVTYQAEDQYDGIICVYDSINYISGQKKLELFFKNVFLNLKFKGVFIFDASLEPNSMNSPELFVQRGRIKKIHYQRESLYDPRTKMHTTRIRVKRNGTVFEEVHNEYVYDIETLRQVAGRAGFTEKFASGDFTMLEVTDNSERVHFVLTKETHD
jgi:ubiquinone/menaquinone biosynthesis C-methylase UbiE